MADYSTICGYVSPAGSDAKPPMSFPSLANSPPSSPPPASHDLVLATAGGVDGGSSSLQRDHAIRSLTEAVNSLHNMSVTRLPSTADAIISDAEVRAFMASSPAGVAATATAASSSNQSALSPSANHSSAPALHTSSSSGSPSPVNETAASAATAKFSPQHAAYSSPNLLQPREGAGRLADRRREGVCRSWTEEKPAPGLVPSPGLARRVINGAHHAYVGQRLAGAVSNEAMGLAVFPRGGGGGGAVAGPFLSAPTAPGANAMTEIALGDGGVAGQSPTASSSHNSSLGGGRREDDIDPDDDELDEEARNCAARRSVIRDISLSPSAGSCRTGSSSGVTGGLEDYLFKPSALDLGGAGGEEEEDRLSLPGSGHLARCGLVLPSVEDGLSSGANSEMNSPKISPRPSRRSRAALAKNSSAAACSGLLNQGIIRAITDDIRDIKRAIAENVELPPVHPSAPPLAGKDLREIVRPPPPPPPTEPEPPEEEEEEAGEEEEDRRNGQRRTDSRTASSEESSVWTKRCASSCSSTAHEDTPAGPVVPGPASPGCSEEAAKTRPDGGRVPDYESDEDTEKLLTKQYTRNERVEIPELQAEKENQEEKKRRGREVAVRHPDNPSVLIEGVLFRARYLGSTQLVTEGQPSKATRMVQAQEAVGRIKAPDGETQPSTDVDLFVSTEKIMVLNTNLKEIMMDHSLKTISYIADIGDVLVIMARRRLVPMSSPSHEESRLGGGLGRQQIKVICHVFESEEAQLIAQSIGHAFQVAYMEFLKANGIEDPSVFKEMDYQEVLNQQEIFGEELALFSDKGMQKEVIIPKQKGEPLGVVIVESGWGSMIPTVVLANMKPTGPAARCGQLNIGDQIIAVNGHSLVGLPLAQCQQRVKGCRKCSSVQLSLVSCSPVVQVRIKRPDLKYQLGFSLQNGVICSLLRGGIAERGGVRVGHRIIEINGESVVGVAHERMVNMLSTCVGEIRMRTMPTCIFRLMTGQEEPVYI